MSPTFNRVLYVLIVLACMFAGGLLAYVQHYYGWYPTLPHGMSDVLATTAKIGKAFFLLILLGYGLRTLYVWFSQRLAAR